MDSITIVRWTQRIFCLAFCAFVFVYDYYSYHQAQNRVESHARAIASSLWNNDSEGLYEYLKLASQYHHYERLSVYDRNNEIFKDFSIPQPSRLDSILVGLRLIPRIPLSAPILYEGRPIGRIEAVWMQHAVYVYAYGFIGLALLLIIARLHVKILRAKNELEKRVKERTGELKEANERLKKGIRERSAAEQALRESEAKYRELVQNANSIILRVDTNGVITFFNEYAQKYFGYSNEEILGKNAIGTIVPIVESTGRLLDEHIQDVFTNPEDYGQNENENMRKDGERVWINWANRPIYDEDGNLTEILCIGIDVTKLRNVQEQLRQSQKMEAIGLLAGGIAHDFNNLLTGIMGYADFVLLEMESSNPSYKKIEEIKKAGERAAALTRQLLTFSRKQIIQPVPLNLNDQISNMERFLRRVIGENIVLGTIPDPDIGTIKADRGQIEQIVINLVVNARDAMPDGGTIWIETSNVHFEEPLILPHSKIDPGDYVTLTVRDTGCGMDKSTQEKIFEPFFTTKEMGKGTGLGLSTVYGIVRQSDGYITVSSQPGEGSEFRVYLPQEMDDASDARTRPAAVSAAKGSETILLVEDNDMVREITKEMLTDAGYAVVEASSGDRALSTFRRSEKPIDLLLTDVILPQMSGRELAERIWNEKPDMKVLFMSGYTEDVILKEGIRDEDIQFIHKPYTGDALLGKLQKILDGG